VIELVQNEYELKQKIIENVKFLNNHYRTMFDQLCNGEGDICKNIILAIGVEPNREKGYLVGNIRVAKFEEYIPKEIFIETMESLRKEFLWDIPEPLGVDGVLSLVIFSLRDMEGDIKQSITGMVIIGEIDEITSGGWRSTPCVEVGEGRNEGEIYYAIKYFN
jgi:hypothetical protein